MKLKLVSFKLNKETASVATTVTGDPMAKRDRTLIVSMASETLYNCTTETGWQLIEFLEYLSCHPYHY